MEKAGTERRKLSFSRRVWVPIWVRRESMSRWRRTSRETGVTQVVDLEGGSRVIRSSPGWKRAGVAVVLGKD